MFTRSIQRLPSKVGRRHFSLFQNVSNTFVALHEATSLPWIILIPLTTVGLRTCLTLPLSVWQRKRVIKQQELRKVVQSIPPVTKLRLAAATNAASKANDNITSSGSIVKEEHPMQIKPHRLTPDQITILAIKETRKRQKRIYGKYNVQMWKNAILPLVQIPLWITVSMGLRNLTEKRLLETHEWSLLHQLFPDNLDLSLPWDSMPMVAPLILGTLSMINVEFNGRVMTSTSTSRAGIDTAPSEYSKTSQGIKSILNVSRLSCILMMGISSQASILLSLYWISSQFYSLLQNIFLDWLWPYQR
ncbi:cytochrome c oxidase assembly protein cox18, mitochondrial [Zygosaccharomyces mellis]|uniref:Cytochrome c oxidase assembly protein cox18, mitochondrial n=1 Tax=Zygosaccharomyces mellis TaxID=42258 RepID=A0A4C2E485_9SACH|nr:cytochrome c oxidase assembly protein cox18, mitochondrial [Zygosaccharomyces mellis]